MHVTEIEFPFSWHSSATIPGGVKGLTSCSSFVHLAGHIIHIFKDLFIEVTHTFTPVAVYDYVTEDRDCLLW